jgi:2'-5' RNA ligase
MQSVCSVLPGEFNARVIEARALFAEDPAIGVIYDPPFAHFTHQLAEDYDWDGLEAALADFAARRRPFEVSTTGILTFTGRSAGAAVAVFRSEELLEYHDDLWKTITPFAKGRVDSFYETRTLVPHVTIKRCGTNWQSFGEGLARLVHLDFQWAMTIDNVSVQHDPGKNSLTHYQRLAFDLGGLSRKPVEAATNAEILSVTAPEETASQPRWKVSLKLDSGEQAEVTWTAPEWVQVMAAANCSTVHFAGGRCRLEAGRITAVQPKTPFPVVA